MADDARPVEEEIAFELVDVAELSDEALDEDLRAAIAAADADIAAGRHASHAEVSKWLETWGTPEFGPAPRPWRR